MSVFCFEEDPCHERPVIRDGALVVVKVCCIVKDGCSVAIKIEPLRYLQHVLALVPTAVQFNIPDSERSTISGWRNGGDWIIDGPS